MGIKISIIVPCYNVEAFLDRCLSSIVNQTIGVGNLQIILVNDASTDGTLEKMKEWEEKYPDNILIITYDKNIRQGGARNRGMEYAEGEYIGFVDSDDWIELQMYEELYEKATKGDYDVVRCKHIRDTGDGKTYEYKEREDQSYFFEKSQGIYIHGDLNCGNNGEYGGLWSGIYKRELLLNNKLFFPEGLKYEDNFWGALLELYQKDLYIVDMPYYHYYANMDSTILKKNNFDIMDKLTIEVMLLEEYKKRGLYELLKPKIFYGFIQRAYLNFLFSIFIRFDYIPIDLNDLIDIVKKCFPDCENWINILSEQSMEHDKFLLKLLVSGQHYTKEMQENIKKEYKRRIIDIYSKNVN